MAINLNLTPGTATAGAGIDVTSVVDQILYSERAPERAWQTQQATLTLQTTVLNTINTQLAALKDKVNNLKDIFGAITAKVATSSQPSLLTASAQTTAANGTHQVVVGSLATTSSYYTDPLTDSATTFSTGTLHLQVGNGTPVDVVVDETNNTLETLVSYINNQKIGITASVVSDANGARLALVSGTSGQPGDLTISGDVSELVFHKSVAGTNATLAVDGVPINSSSNTVTGALPGVTLNLLNASAGTPIQVTVDADATQAKQAVQDFVDSYNLLISSINSQFTVNPSNYTAGPLASDGSLRSLQASLLSDATYSITGNNGIIGLSSLGLDMANDGTLTVNDATLTDVISNHFTDFQNFFQEATGGFANHFSTDLSALTDSTRGVISLDLAGISSTQHMLSTSIADFEDRLVIRQQQLTNEYSRVDAMLRQYPLIMQQVTGQLATLLQTTTTS